MKNERLNRLFRNPWRLFSFSAGYGLFNWLPDQPYLKCMYRALLGRKLGLDKPQSFNEKIQWMKLFDRDPLYTKLVDKYEVREFVREQLGEKYLVPLLGIWEKPEEIDFGKLPEQFVLKCTHDCGSIIICRDKKNFKPEKARKELKKSLNYNYYKYGREWPYRGVNPRIIAEEYLSEPGRLVPEDYKVYCFNGEPRLIVVFHNRFDNTKELSESVYDTNWNLQDYSLDHHFKVCKVAQPRPECLEELLSLSKKLCSSFALMRTDFYIVGGQIYFGEITLHTASGFSPMVPEEMDQILGGWLDLNYGKNSMTADIQNRREGQCRI